jgi:hypothetical protein
VAWFVDQPVGDVQRYGDMWWDLVLAALIFGQVLQHFQCGKR